MDAESEEFGGQRKFFAHEFARYGWAKLMRSGLGGHEILNLYAFKTSFVELNFGYGSALAVSLLVITMVVSGTLFYLRTARRKEAAS